MAISTAAVGSKPPKAFVAAEVNDEPDDNDPNVRCTKLTGMTEKDSSPNWVVMITPSDERESAFDSANWRMGGA